MFIGITYLGAFAKLWNVIMPCYFEGIYLFSSPVHVNNSVPSRWIFMKFDI